MEQLNTRVNNLSSVDSLLWNSNTIERTPCIDYKILKKISGSYTFICIAILVFHVNIGRVDYSIHIILLLH